MVFSTFFNFSLNLAIRSSAPSLVFCWLYRASPSLAAKNIINLISVLTIWWCPCIESLWKARWNRFWKKDTDSFSGKLTKLYFFSESFYALEQGKSLQKSRLHRWSLSTYKVDNSKFTKLMRHIDSIFSGSRDNLLSSRPPCYSQHCSHAVLKPYMQEMFLREKHRDMHGGSGPSPDPCEDLLLKAVT